MEIEVAVYTFKSCAIMIFNENFMSQLAGSECRFFRVWSQVVGQFPRNRLSKCPACKLRTY